jgi:putative CocE/NonD family hydrolase
MKRRVFLIHSAAAITAMSCATRGVRASAEEPGIRVVDGAPAGASSPIRYGIRHRYDVLTPMRDGVKLAMDLQLPDAPGPFPVILARTPYDKVSFRIGNAIVPEFVRRGYAVAIQDCRGRFNSDGEFDPYRQEHADGFDTIEWIAQQDWCDGNIGMIGGSYVAQTQWLAASQTPKALKAIAPRASPPGHPFLNEPFYGGAFLLQLGEWTQALGRRAEQLPGMVDLHTRWQEYFDVMPLSKVPEQLGVTSPWFEEWLKHPTYDEYWQSHAYEQYWSRITVPALNITGWWDMNFLGAPRNFVAMGRQGATQEARDGRRLIIGPWPHRPNRVRELNGVDFGPTSVTGLDGYTIRFFDRWLRGLTANGLDRQPRVHVFVVGANEWWASDDWPLPGTRMQPYYLHSGGNANTHRGDGTLSLQPPAREPPDRYVSDPRDPIRVLWRIDDGPVDDRPLSARPDVLCYTSEVLKEPLDVVGPVTAVLYASSSARDCDWHVRLIDVHPDGAARFMCHGVLRARFREGYDRAAFLKPGEITRFEIDMTAIGVRFLPGHRVRIEIASSWFTQFDRNPQTDAANWMTDQRPPVVAHQRIYHDKLHASHLLLPVIPAGSVASSGS